MASIFVVEDDPDIADLIAHYLQKAGHAVKRLTSGTEVMPQLRAAPPDLVILDLMLPGMDGLLVCQAMRADAATASIPPWQSVTDVSGQICYLCIWTLPSLILESLIKSLNP